MSPVVYVINGPNLNLLGKRQPEIYGHTTLRDVEEMCAKRAKSLKIGVRFFQSNYEGQIVEWIHDAREEAQAIVINPGALTHTSVAVLDALNAFDGHVIELHISQIHKRESFRHHSYVSLRADGIVAGLGTAGYPLAVEYVAGVLAPG